MAKILVVDDELTIIEVIKPLLTRGGHEVFNETDGEAALQRIKEEVFDLLITDIRLPGMDGMTLLQKAKELQSQLAVIVMTAYGGVDTAVEAMRNGAYDYITKPFKFTELMVIIDKALSYEKIVAEHKLLKTSLKTKYHFDLLIGDSEPMLEIYRLIEKVAKTNTTVLIRGASGTGKELVARAIHKVSPRSEYPFIPVNCSAMPETLLESELFGYVKGAFTGANSNKKGLFETADKGTIFLDEISCIPVSMQTKLLRVLQEKTIRYVGGTENIPVDVRVIAATNENLEDKLQEGSFREDLYYRLSVIPILLPELKKRKDDIPLLISHFLSLFEKENRRKIDISEGAMEILKNYSFPGNVRELENLINRLATLCDNNKIEEKDIPETIKNFNIRESLKVSGSGHLSGSAISGGNEPQSFIPLKEYIKKAEAAYIKSIVTQCEGDKEKAAEILGISLATLYRKL